MQRPRAVWKRLYDPRRGHRIPALLLNHAEQAIAAVVDEIAFQPRRALAERTLAAIIPFSAARSGGDPARRGRDRSRPVRRASCRRASSSAPPRYAIENGAACPSCSRSGARHLLAPRARLTSSQTDPPIRVAVIAARLHEVHHEAVPTRHFDRYRRASTAPGGDQGRQPDPPAAADRRPARSARGGGRAEAAVPEGRAGLDAPRRAGCPSFPRRARCRRVPEPRAPSGPEMDQAHRRHRTATWLR